MSSIDMKYLCDAFAYIMNEHKRTKKTYIDIHKIVIRGIEIEIESMWSDEEMERCLDLSPVEQKIYGFVRDNQHLWVKTV
ncbi:hypothetical protein AP1_0018 [Aeromonas phage AP1]|nr:hypothetical protein AP1_0018 [Aeromonas phage AP1]